MKFYFKPNVSRYQLLLHASLEARLRGDDESEDRITGEMETVWYALSAQERNEMRAFTALVATHHLDMDGRVVNPLIPINHFIAASASGEGVGK